jgi:hypothetical protein
MRLQAIAAKKLCFYVARFYPPKKPGGASRLLRLHRLSIPAFVVSRLGTFISILFSFSHRLILLG